jgi:mannose-6-phosphate isomerase-like protein (cupin superfamily)
MPDNMRRVVTSRTQDGKSVLVSDGKPPRATRLESLPELEVIDIWATDGIPQIPLDVADPTLEMSSFLPSPGGTRFRIICISPVSNYATQTNGMHSSDSVEYVIVLVGDVWLLLDSGTEIHLQAGDCVVQNGTQHAWQNRGSNTTVIAAVVLGAKLR